MTSAALLDYGAGNLRSAQRALERAGFAVTATDDAERAGRHDVLVVPGVGHFGQCVRRFRQAGLESLVHRWVEDGRPLLGICVGMQILYEASEEDPGEAGLGVLRGGVRRLPAGQVIPHMGWNTLEIERDDALVRDLAGQHVYFVHSYYTEPGGAEVLATAAYGLDVPAVVRSGSVVGAQFHPEKSGDAGGRLLAGYHAEVSG